MNIWTESICDRAKILMAALLISGPASADVGGFFDAMDLNDFALGFYLWTAESRYAGADNSVVLYPAPVRFEHSLNTEGTFFLRNSSTGLQWHNDSGWRYGALINYQAYGYGPENSAVLAGMRRRHDTLQAGGLIGRRIGPVHIELTASADILGEHNGWESSLSTAWIFSGERYEFVPELRATWESDKLVNHYFGVLPDEVQPGRAAYRPGSTLTWSALLDLSWRLSPKWYVSAAIAWDVIPDEIRRSPLVDKDVTARGLLSIAYDADAFRPVLPWTADIEFEIGVGAFFADADTNVNVVTGGSTTTLQLENDTGIGDSETAYPIELAWNFGRYHRVEMAWLDLRRSRQAANFRTRFETSVLKVGYGVALMRDTQKEFVLFGGLHLTDIELDVEGVTGTVSASTDAVMPVIGARFDAWFRKRFSVGATADIFALDFDRIGGIAFDVSVNATWKFSDHWRVAGGYRLFRQDFEIADDSYIGDLRNDYGGPFVTLKTRF